MLLSVIKQNHLLKYILIGGGVLFLFDLGKAHVENWHIEQNAGETPGTVIDFKSTGRSSLLTTFEYRVNGIAYRTTSISNWFKGCLQKKWCIGERFMIRYSLEQPDNAKVLWDKHLQRVNCSIAHEGRFLDESIGGSYVIIRNTSEQFEYNPDLGEIRMRLQWLDSCTYQLFDRTVLSGTGPSFPALRSDTITVHIVSTDSVGFTYEARTSSTAKAITGRQQCIR